MRRGEKGLGGKGKKNANHNTANAPPRSNSIAAWQGCSQPRTRLAPSDESRTNHQWNVQSQETHDLLHTPVGFAAAGVTPLEEFNQATESGGPATKPSTPARHPWGGDDQLSISNESTQNGTQAITIRQRMEDDASEANQRRLASMSINGTGATNGMMVRELELDEKSRILNTPHSMSSNMNFFIDSNFSRNPIKTGFPPPIVRHSESPTYSDSGDEIIVFSGRGNKKPLSSESVAVTQPSRPQILDDEVLPSRYSRSFTVRASLAELETPSVLTSSQTGKLRAEHESDSAKRARSSKNTTKTDELLADYIANMEANNIANDLVGMPQLKPRDLDLGLWGAQEEAFIADKKGSGKMQDDDVEDDDDDWDSVDLQDFDCFSTSSESMDSLPQILGKRLRNSVQQYLVISDGQSKDKARWLPIHLLTSHSAAELISSFEEKAGLRRSTDDDDNESVDSLPFEEQLAMHREEDLDAMEDERDLEDRRNAHISDENVAMLLQKQAELGIIGDRLVLINADALGTEPRDLGQASGSRTAAVRSRYSVRQKRKSKKRSGNVYPSAALFADVPEQDPYNGFDIMDQQRPSLRKNPKKSRRHEAMPEISDSDLQQSINTAWENDRMKKKQRKQEREELRAQGLLGKNGKPDLKAKFGEGMTLMDVKRLMKDFLESLAESLPLPPMAQRERKEVHMIANKAGLKSKSVGSGTARFPVLYKTSRTKPLMFDLEAQIDALFTEKRFLPRLDKVRRRSMPMNRGRGGLASAASYRDGEVVGIGAPELGSENKGRVMLEKMGWSTGTALGASNNKGISQPIAQVVKTSKAGLG